ncbi:dihydropteroate synthase [Terriglobus saanensis]|uniref:Dihydropteroate synthase n=1 Tax=Terriglobus saanensis (strain ATCC BAA-1853 / DSM 23119 / SP1PR4) TaxID=401053 RepID=E8V0Q9_TERSS|nr:dihydropteroate synthase [Terriglobus saanensis]ADV81122.1 dihydropteroate synthase [Terriglobus saanensis SP1PR4]
MSFLTHPRPEKEWRIGSRTLFLGSRTLLMGIVNLTPDSFSDGGQFSTTQTAIDHALRLLDEGAEILDLGAESTRPGATLDLAAEDEQQRLAPVLEGILRARPDCVLSVDTFRASTARFAVERGALIVNDVSGLTWDCEMAQTLATLSCGAILMHTRGLPLEWKSQKQLAPTEVMPTVTDGLTSILANAEQADISLDRIVLDPGFGFGKRAEENLTLLAHFGELHRFGRPLLVGLSRKGFLAPHLAPRDRVPATVAANTAAILAGAHILRVHDVAAARQASDLADSLLAQTIAF